MADESYALSELAKSFKPGIYQHFKGGIYDALFVGRSSEAREEEFVIYRSLEKETVWIRPLAMFLEDVDRDGYKGPRFMYLGEASFLQGFDKVYVHNAVPVEQDPPHSHDFDTRLLILSGEIGIRMNGAAKLYKASDVVDIPRGTEHAAVTGREGCRYIVAERH